MTAHTISYTLNVKQTLSKSKAHDCDVKILHENLSTHMNAFPAHLSMLDIKIKIKLKFTPEQHGLLSPNRAGLRI